MDPRIVHLDSTQMRVLAHPLRARMLAALRMDGSATSAELARRLGTNTGATSYHLRRLADAGLVTEDEDRGTRRERWWAAAHDITSWAEGDFRDDPDDRAAADWLAGAHARTKAGWVADWLAARDEWSREWLAAADHSDYMLRLSPGQLAALNTELHEVIGRYLSASPGEAHDVQRVLVLLDSFPSPDPRI
jgi:DNA-binding transcriptional ArsR family regulator